ncbi:MULTISPECIES: YbjN domain-containing protein [unclassified Exiguobacterium]|uniref:YbjN domain-containing protein n=1 Tax=unclassified Exiguobacterium TaxID=2644629 RepID=UPI000B58B97F|nr:MULTISPECIES: YbjN domain-containing protein [unclassified Exiguobacterium]ASI36612.1 YbjN domain-containing protein [Exiguobacterium sp. N4-1P]
MDQDRNSNETNEDNKVTPLHPERNQEGTNENGVTEVQQQHLEAFQAFLVEKGIPMEARENETHVFFMTQEKTPAGAEPMMMIVFSKTTTDVELFARTVTHVPDGVEDLPILNAINDFNQEFKYFRVVLDSDRDVTIASTIDLDHGFNPAAIFGHSVMMFQASDEVYAYLTKLYDQIQ